MNFVSIQLEETAQPKYMQLFFFIKEAIYNGELETDEKLPSVRVLAKALGINNATVVSAYKELEKEGYIYVKKGSGYYICESTSTEQLTDLIYEEEDGELINFASATPHPSIFPTETFKVCINEVIERDKGYAFGYQESNGYKPLRESLADYMKSNNHLQVSPNAVQIVSGSQQGLDLIGKTLLTPGDYVITEIPTYYGAMEVFKSRGARVVGVKLEKDGIDLLDLEKKIRVCKPKVVYLMVNYQNPTTISYSQEKMKQLMVLAKQYDFFIVEDDSMSELTFDTKEPRLLKTLDVHDKVIYIKSFSKLLMPGLRIGYLVLPSNLIEAFTRTKQSTDITSSGLIQRALDLYFRSGRWQEHLHYMRAIYNGKYEIMLHELEALGVENIQFERPNGGLYFWIRLPDYLSADTITKKALEEGVKILCSKHFYPNRHDEKDRFIRLSFAAPDVGQIKEGIQILKSLIT